MQQNTLTEGRIGPVLLRFAIPFLAANLLQALYGAADLFVVGRFDDAAALAGVSIGSQIMQTLTSIVMGLSTGGTVLIGRCIGARDDEGAAKALGTIALTFGAAALLLTGLMLVVAGPSIGFMQTPAEAVADTQNYLTACVLGIPFIVGYNAVSGIFRGMGDSKTPVFFIALACAINIAADFFLVGYVGLGAMGAAIATVTAQGISFIASLWHMYRRGFSFPFGREHLRVDKASLRQILGVGLPLSLQQALVSVSFLIITAIMNSMGLIAAAAVGVVEKLINFAMLPPSSFASAVATATAQNIGAGKQSRALKGMAYGIGYSLVFGLFVCGASQVIPHAMASIFSSDPLVINAAADYLRSFSIDCVLVSFVFCANSYFNGCGQAVFTMAHNLAATFFVRVPLSYLLSRRAGGSLFLIGLAAPAASLFSVAVCLIYFFYLYRKGRHAAHAG